MTYAACLTPPGAAAIAVLAVRGPHAWDIVKGLFHPRSSTGLPPTPTVGQFWLGTFGEELTDEVVVSVRRTAPYPWLEIHSHGGPEVVRMLLELLAAHGAQVVSWQDLEKHTQESPLHALALNALAHAPTVRTAGILLDQLHGAFASAIDAVRAALETGNIDEARNLLASLVRQAPLGRHLVDPWKVAILGPPNVGKSSLVNALTGFTRSLVDAAPGTTRDVVTARIAIDGWPIELSDTAGQRNSTDDLEQAGIDRARLAASQADLRLWLLDASTPPVWPPDNRSAYRYVINKIDQPPAWQLDEAVGATQVSALTAAGLDGLCESLAHWLVAEPPTPGMAVPFTMELCEAVEAVERYLREARIVEANATLPAR